MTENKQPCIGILGGGQLGRMLILEAHKMGYQVAVWTDDTESGDQRIADHVILDSYDSEVAYQKFLSLSDVVTVEFENIPSALIESLSDELCVIPGTRAVSICQNREREKSFLAENGIPTAKFKIVDDATTFGAALEVIPGDVIIKTVESGYDGKGQMQVSADAQAGDTEKIWAEFGGGRAIVEEKIDLKAEISVIVARGQDGEMVTFDPAENEHTNHILDISIVPARLPDDLLSEAKEVAKKVARELDYVGVLGVEFFVNQSGELLVNEMAPRPHNSGHHTIDACETSQFEQQLRVITGLPLGSTKLLKPVVMLNVLGDSWKNAATPPDWSPVLSMPGASLHLYGKKTARSRRKMGHITFRADTIEEALDQANACRDFL